MHGTGDIGQPTVPAFLTKLWTLVEDPATDSLIKWGAGGKSFHVFDQNRLAKELLPLYFKHSNMASFIRQLNMYGFRKVVNVEQGALKTEKDDMEFTHPYFIRGQEQLLDLIKRKQVTSTKAEDIKVKGDELNHVLIDVQGMKGKQDNMNGKLDTLKRENEALWREVANLRQKHMKQQQIVNRLIQFLLTLVGSNRGVAAGMKRRMPLMINQAPSKQPKFTSQLSVSDVKGEQSAEGQPSSSLTISDVTDNAMYSGLARSSPSPKVEQSPASMPIPSPQNIPAEMPVSDFLLEVQSPDPDLPTELDMEHLIGLTGTPASDTPVCDTSGNADVLSMAMRGIQESNSTMQTLMDMNVHQPSGSQQISPHKNNTKLLPQETSTVTASSSSTPSAVTVPDNHVTRVAKRFRLPSTSEVVGATNPYRLPVAAAAASDSCDVSGKMWGQEVNDHLDNLQSDLESLKEVLATGQYNIDSNMLFGLFTPDPAASNLDMPFMTETDLFGLTVPDPTASSSSESANFITGGGNLPFWMLPKTSDSRNELMQYTPQDEIPSLLDFGVLGTTEPLELDTLSYQSGLETPQPSGLAKTEKLDSPPLTEEVD